jgi:hypothetical protein
VIGFAIGEAMIRTASRSPRRTLAIAAGLFLCLLAPRANAADPPLVGLFEGNGIAPPADPARTRVAIAGAQRLATLCLYFFQQRGGGTMTGGLACSDSGVKLALLGRDGAAALLDVLDQPRQLGPYATDSLPALLEALGRTGREDVVPVLVTGLERIDARAELHDERVREFARSQASYLSETLTTLTYLQRYEQPWQNGKTQKGAEAAGWRAWWEQNKQKTRSDWRREAIARAREKLATPEVDTRIDAALFMAQTVEAHADGLSALKRIVRTPQCEAACWPGRQYLHKLEPRGHWVPPSQGD